MLNRYFIRPTTVDRIRASWIGDAIERYVAWLDEQDYATRNIFVRARRSYSASESSPKGRCTQLGRTPCPC